MKYHFKNFKDRVHKNVKGQVAIFVALVFQVIFILFALMINVGLLIHHKINLQQSTDLAAYYGAMKQAEILNVVAHVNFQIRQAYKLMAWRYRVLGTFGMQRRETSDPIIFPISHLKERDPQTQSSYVYNSTLDKCRDEDRNNVEISPLEIPYMCMNHYGFKDSVGDRTTDQTFCKANCNQYRNGPFSIPQITGATTGGAGNHDTGIIGAINTAINQANQQLDNACKITAPITIAQLSKYYASYIQEVKNRKLFIKMMMANLSTGETESLDVEGNKVIDGVKNTLINNLTEANNSSFGKDGNIFETYNSVSAARGSSCAYTDLNEVRDSSGNAALFAEINFQFIQYFLLKCTMTTSGDRDYKAESIYEANSGGLDLNGDLITQLNTLFGNNSNMAARIKDIMIQNYYDHTVGIEKNPWCGVYYGVKASTTPVIPFLPISKVTLFASSFAKPFGGSIGPRQYKEWPSSANKSDATGGATTQTDAMLPIQNPTGSNNINNLIDNKKILLNYSNFVGDQEGLSNPQVVGIYHDMLLNRNVTTSSLNHSVSTQKTNEPATTKGAITPKPTAWPAYSNWDNVGLSISSPDYDPLALEIENNSIKNSFIRDIELSVVAPNQFEMTYYSIEPDFYNVYGKGKLAEPNVLNKFKERAGLNSPVYFPKDFGHNDQLAQRNAIPQNFSVRNQMEVVHHIMRNANQSAPPTFATYSFGGPYHSQNIDQAASMYFTYVPYLPGSLLTSWTMKDLISDDFSVIPKADDTKTPFAACLDEDLHGANGYGSIAEAPNPQGGGSEKLPPAPGNCITGGRTGYSVKIVSPAGLMKETVGDQEGTIRNPPTDFLVF